MAYNIKTVFTASSNQFQNAVKSVQASINNIKISTDNMKSSVKSDFEKAGGSAKVLNTGLIAATAAVVAITRPAIKAGIAALGMAANYESAVQTLGYTLGNAKVIVDDFVDNNATAMGMASADAYKFANIYSNLLTTMTSSQEVNATMTNKLLAASSVIMSKTGRTFSDVADRIRSGLLGNTEAIEDLGVQVNVSLLQTTDAFKQISDGRSWDKLSFQEQQQIRLLGILEQTSKKYGEEVSDNLSLTLAQNAAVFKDVKTEASQFLSIGLEPLLSTIKNVGSSLLVLVKSFNTLDDTTKKNITTFLMCVSLAPVVILALFLIIKAMTIYKSVMSSAIMTTKIFGVVSIKSILGPAALIALGLGILCIVFGSLGNVVKNLGNIFKIVGYTILSSVTAVIGGILSLISILIPSLKSAANSCMNLSRNMYSSAQNTLSNAIAISKSGKSATGASDTINNLTNSTNNNAKSAEDAAKANKKLQDNLQGFDEINKLNPDTTSSSAGDTIDMSGLNLDTPAFENFGTTITDIKEKVSGFIEKIKELGPTIVSIGAILFGAGIIIFISQVASGLSGVFNIIKLFATSPEFIGIALVIAGICLIIMSLIQLVEGDLWKSFQTFLVGLGLIIVGITIAIGIVPALITGIVVAIVYLIAVLVTNWDAFCAGCKHIFETIVNWIVDKWQAFCTGFMYILNIIKDKFIEIWNAIVNFFKTIIDWIISKATDIKNWFINVWNSIKNTACSCWEWIKSIFSGFWKWICDKANSIGNTFSNIWEGIKNGFINVWNTITEFAGNIGTTVADAVGGTIKSVVNTIISFAENTINGFIKAINLAINLINAIPGVNIGKMPLLNIPRLATGGVTTGSTIANIGEGRYKEAVIPLENSPQFRDMKSDIASEILSKMSKSDANGTVRKIEIDILAGGVKMGKKILDLLDETEDFYGFD